MIYEINIAELNSDPDSRDTYRLIHLAYVEALFLSDVEAVVANHPLYNPPLERKLRISLIDVLPLRLLTKVINNIK